MFNTVLVLYVLAYSALGEVCNLVAGPSPIHFDNPKSWDCQHVPTASSDVVVALQQGQRGFTFFVLRFKIVLCFCQTRLPL